MKLYFCIIANPWFDKDAPSPHNQPTIFILCGQSHWDREMCLDDELTWSEHGFVQLAEGHYAHSNVDQAKARLIHLGHSERGEMGHWY